MAKRTTVTRALTTQARALRHEGESVRAIATQLGVSPTTVQRMLSKTRRAQEFTGATARSVEPPTRSAYSYTWDLEQIRAARDAQMTGRFLAAVRLAEAMRTDDALYSAYHNRVAPQSAVEARLVAHPSVRGLSVRKKALASIIVARETLKGIHGTLANHGVAIGYLEHEPNEVGTQVNMRLVEWPLEFVRYVAADNLLETSTLGGEAEPIVHGDGRWVVFRKFEDRPWLQEACLLPGSFIWAAHGHGISDWASASTSHGQAKLIGEMPEGIPIEEDEAGTLTREAEGFLQTLQNIVSGASGAALRPAGSKTDFVANGSTAWQVFRELILNREKAAARVYLGSDAMLGSVGGAPGIDISTLFGIATTIVQGDLEAIESALYTGVYAPWTAINCGDSSLAPHLEYDMPDPDENAKSEERAKNEERFTKALQARRDQKLVVDQEVVNELATRFSIYPVPQLAEATNATTSITLAPTDVARIVRVQEARASVGLPPLGDERDQKFLSELEAAAAAEAAADAEPAPTATPTEAA